jgi:hypothetical protein
MITTIESRSRNAGRMDGIARIAAERGFVAAVISQLLAHDLGLRLARGHIRLQDLLHRRLLPRPGRDYKNQQEYFHALVPLILILDSKWQGWQSVQLPYGGTPELSDSQLRPISRNAYKRRISRNSLEPALVLIIPNFYRKIASRLYEIVLNQISSVRRVSDARRIAWPAKEYDATFGVKHL